MVIAHYGFKINLHIACTVPYSENMGSDHSFSPRRYGDYLTFDVECWCERCASIDGAKQGT